MAALADLKARRGDWTDRRTGKREARSSTKCYIRGQYGHYKLDCPQRRKSKYTERQLMRPSAIECRLCAGNHYIRECPKLETAKRMLSQESASSDFKLTLARTSTPSDSISVFKKDGTAIIYETDNSPVQIIDPAMPMSEESTPGTARM